MSPPGEENTEIKNLADDANAYPCLEILSGPKGGRFLLQQGKNNVGRSRDNDVVLDDSSVSRRHVVIDVAENGATIADMGSRNGTKINGQKIQQATSLTHKTKVKIGVYYLRFLTEPAEAETVAPVEEDISNAPSSPDIPIRKDNKDIEGDENPALPVQGAGLQGAPEAPLTYKEVLQAGEVVPVAETSGKGGKKIFLFLGLAVILVVVIIFSVPLDTTTSCRGETSRSS